MARHHRPTNPFARVNRWGWIDDTTGQPYTYGALLGETVGAAVCLIGIPALMMLAQVACTATP